MTLPNSSQYLYALAFLSSAVAESHDLREVLHRMIDQVTNLLHVHAAAVLLYNPPAQQFRYVVSRGFRTEKIDQLESGLVADFRQRAMHEPQVVYIPVLSEATTSDRTRLIQSEGFVSYYGLPFFFKQQSLGALELFHRAPLRLDPEAVAFLRALCAEVVLAVNNTDLFHQLERSNLELERSNLELEIAYEATIRGWVRALDLRDRETAGHTLRVTQLTLQVARRIGMTDEQLAYIGRGALLHDIGKLGLPDVILYKPGPLSAEELKVLKQHPVLGYELLSPIEFLQPALDIVYCHHERWDGSGYPRGLKGEKIPLSARIFAVVDVWDALVSDRVFRRGSPKAEAVAYLKDHAGKTLDPQIVETFLTVVDG